MKNNPNFTIGLLALFLKYTKMVTYSHLTVKSVHIYLVYNMLRNWQLSGFQY